MKSSKLALNRWAMGQVLMPAHFQTLQSALLHHVGLRFELHGLPGYGIARMQWDDALVRKGAISIALLTAIFPSGELFDVPGNAIISNLNFGDEPGDRVDVYLHVSSADTSGQGLALYEHDPDEVNRLVHKLELSTRPWLDDARQSMKLAEIDRGGDGDWQLGGYIPPLLQVGSSPFLRTLVAELFQALTRLENQLATQLADAYLGGEHVARLRRAQAALHRLRAFLADIESQIHPHPFYFLNALREFYLEVCLMQNSAPQASPVIYDHDALATCFGQIQRLIMERMRISTPVSARLPFVRDGQRFVARPFSEALLGAREVFLVIQRPAGAAVSLDEVKLASPGRLELVHINALSGVGFEKVTASGFSHTFGSGADIYRLQLADEWQHAAREGAIAFYARPYMDGLSAMLSWRS